MIYIAIAALNLACAVMLGAFGAHGLKHIADATQLAWWQTATDYFFYHALGLLALGLCTQLGKGLAIKTSFVLMQTGILLFCGSLYAMALGMPKVLGAITPLGGGFMILAWLCLAWQAFKQHRNTSA